MSRSDLLEPGLAVLSSGGTSIFPLGPALLAFVIAGLIAFLELVTSEYPQTFSLMGRSWRLYTYSTIYGLIGLGVLMGLGALVEANKVRVEGLGLSSPWVQAIAIGLTVKAILHIRLFAVSVGQQSLPIGVETLVQLFEPWLLRGIEIDHFNAVRTYIDPRAANHPDLNDVKTLITQNLPSGFADQERAAFEHDVNEAETVPEAMELYLRFVGRKAFKRVFGD